MKVTTAVSATAPWARDAASGVCGAVALTAVGCPFDVVKLRVQTARAARPPGVLATLARVVAAEGVTTLWRGAGAALASALTENVVVYAPVVSL